MLELIDESLEAFLRASVPLSAPDVDVSFEAPDREWSAKLTRPTVNLFLWDIRRSAGRSKGGVRTVEHDGEIVHMPAMPTLELRYVVTAWTSDHGDERALLSGLIRSMLAYGTIPAEYTADGLRDIGEPRLVMARAGEDHIDVFKALEGQLKPGINMVLTTDFDAGIRWPAGPPVGAIEVAAGRIDGDPFDRIRRVAGEVVDAAERGALGAVVRGPTDATRVNPAGQFLLDARTGDEITLEIDPPAAVVVPERGGVRIE